MCVCVFVCTHIWTRFQTFYRIEKWNESEINSNQTLTENEMEIADCNLHIYLFILDIGHMYLSVKLF